MRFFLAIAVVLSSALCTLSSELSVEKFPFGHIWYPEAKAEMLEIVGTYRGTKRTERLHKITKKHFKRMQRWAKKDGVNIILISGHRSVSKQKYLWKRAIKRYKTQAKAARWVAPPGYSEHHTGYAMDLGDQDRYDMDTHQSFDETSSYQWLTKNAKRFGFELSYPKGVPGIQYEPWHWRFVGTLKARKLFHPLNKESPTP